MPRSSRSFCCRSRRTPRRWLLGESKLCGAHVWFRLHVALQSLGFALMTAGFAIAWYFLEDPESYAGQTGEAHLVLGTIVFAFACVQASGCSALSAPAPGVVGFRVGVSGEGGSGMWR